MYCSKAAAIPNTKCFAMDSSLLAVHCTCSNFSGYALMGTQFKQADSTLAPSVSATVARTNSADSIKSCGVLKMIPLPVQAPSRLEFCIQRSCLQRHASRVMSFLVIGSCF